MVIKILILLSISLIWSITSLTINEIKCVCKDSMFPHVRNIRYCEPENPVKIFKKNVKTNVITNEIIDIQGIRFQNQEIYFVPLFHQDLSAKFRLLSIIKSKLQEIKSETLEHWPALEVLELNHNNIIYLERNLLKNNKNLRTFDISSNKIYAIHPTVFDLLEKLLYFNIRDNKCVSQAYDNPNSIKNDMNNLKTKCSNDLHSLLNQNYISLRNLQKEQSELLKKLEKVKEKNLKMTQAELIIIVALCCVIAGLILYIILTNCMNSSNQRFRSKVLQKNDMFEETSSILFSSIAGGLDDYSSRKVANNFNSMNRNQLTQNEDSLPENIKCEYAKPILFTKHEIQQTKKNLRNYKNSKVNPKQKSSKYQNCGQFSDGSDVQYQNYPFGQSTNNFKNLGKNSTFDIQDVDKNMQKVSHKSAEYISKGAASAETIGQGSGISSQNTIAHSINNLSLTKQPDSFINSSSYDSSTQRLIKTAEIGKKTVKYTNFSCSSSQTEGTEQGQPKVDQKINQTNPQTSCMHEYLPQSSTSSTGSIKRPKTIPNLQMPKFYDQINQKLQVITPIGNKSFEFQSLKSPGFNALDQKDSVKSRKTKKLSSSFKSSIRSVNVHQSLTKSTVKRQKSFNFDKSSQQLPDLPKRIQNLTTISDFGPNYSNSGKFSPSSSTAFSFNLSSSDTAPKLSKRNNLTLTKNRESVDVEYCEPFLNTDDTELYSEPYSPNKEEEKQIRRNEN